MKKLVLLMVLSCLAACSGTYPLRGPGLTPVVKGKFAVQPGELWNKVPKGPAKSSEVWTKDGPILDKLTFYGNLRGGTALLKGTKKQTLPVFRANMLANDVAELIEATYVSQFLSQFKLLSLKPRMFGGVEGFSIEYAFSNQNDRVPRRGLAVGAIKDHRLFLILYTAPELYYYERNLEAANRVIDSAIIP